MNKKIKAIDLLNEIANNESYRPKVKFQEMTYTYHHDIGDYTNDFNSEYGIFSGWALNLMLNSEVEILEDNTEKIGELAEWITRRDGEVTQQEGKRLEMCYKINELVKAVNKLKEGQE